MSAPLPIAELVGGTVMLLLLAAATRALSKRIKLPYTVMLVLVGIAVAQFSAIGPEFLRPVSELDISADIFILIFLPALIFESAFNLDSRQLRQNILPVLFLAVPGVLLSTALIGGLLWLVTPFSLPAALVLGALLSATDPVAVISLFKQLGAPKRLTVLVEGESLFNDATAIVLTRILLVVLVSGALSVGDVVQGVFDFVWVFCGGLIVGWLAAIVIGFLLSKVEDDPFIEVPLTLVLAYFSFLLAEEVFHVSGVMATVAAGLVMGAWGRTKISPAVSKYLSELWEYFAFTANALIFLLVGLLVDLAALWHALDLLAWVILAMLFSRAVVVYSLVPLAGKLPGAPAVSLPYQSVMYWGGLRGAIALALALGLPDLPYKETFVALTAGAVLFTLLVQGLSIGALVHWLKLDQAPLGDRLACAGTALEAARQAHQQIGVLRTGGVFSERIARVLQAEYQAKADVYERERQALRAAELHPIEERALLFLHGFTAEKRIYYDMFSKGHLAESSYRDLVHSLDTQIDYIRLHQTLPRYTLHSLFSLRMERALLQFAGRFLGFTRWPDRLSLRYTARDYAKTWGQYQGSTLVLAELDEIARVEGFSDDSLVEVKAMYQTWRQSARKRMDSTAEQFPEFVNVMQERLGRRLLLYSEREVVLRHVRHSQLTAGMGESLTAEIDLKLRQLRGHSAESLHVDAAELLRKVPFFQHLTETECADIQRYLHERTVPPNEYIIREGERGLSLFMIARGVVRVLRTENGAENALGTLLAGDFFGEKALLHDEPRSATCRSITACALYELRRDDFNVLLKRYPDLQAAVYAADKTRAR
jgi:monovalent cation:H+ antiporter, CPA1 family